jgi:hypothetical protein
VVLAGRPAGRPARRRSPPGLRFDREAGLLPAATRSRLPLRGSIRGDVHRSNILGASVARQCLEAGLLDEILVFIAPVLLGDGVRLFDHPGGTNVRLERLSLTSAPQATNLLFRVVR